MAKHVVMAAYGGGVNSTAMLIGLVERGEHVDAILFADTGGEKPATYAYLWTFTQWLNDHGLTLIIVHKRSMYASLEDECLRSATLPSKVYGYSRCSEKWKIQPQERYANNWEPAQAAWNAGEKVTKLIGIDAGETGRAKITENDKYLYRYPLIEWDWARDECLETIRRAGLPLPPKSACFYCPSSKKPEVLALAKQQPELFERALEIERRALASEKLRTIDGLGRHWSWKRLLELDELDRSQLSLLPEPSEATCVCYDGE